MGRNITLDVATNHEPTYLFDGLPESVLRTCPCGREVLKWVHINVYSYIKDGIIRCSWTHPFVFQKILRTERIEQKNCPNPTDVLDFIKDSLLSDSYLIMFVADEVIRPNAGFGPHEFLIHGIDSESLLVRVTGFDGETMFGSFDVAGDTFRSAYECGFKSSKFPAFPILKIFVHKECRPSGQSNILQHIGHELRLLRDSTIDPMNFRAEISRWWFRDPKPESGDERHWRFGIDSYEHIFPYVSTIDDSPELFDYRFFHFAYQYRQELYKIFNVYAALNRIDIRPEALDFQPLLTSLASARISALRFHHGENLQISRATSLFQQCRETEIKVLDKLSVACRDN